MGDSSGDVKHALGDTQRAAWVRDTNVGFIVIGVTQVDQQAQGESKASLGLLECGVYRSHKAPVKLPMT